jgi:hypothetical protein
MAETVTLTLDEQSQEIIRQVIEDGLGTSPEEIILIALRHWYSNHLLAGYSTGEQERIGREAIEDTRPGLPQEEVFARLEALCETLDAKHHNVNAA